MKKAKSTPFKLWTAAVIVSLVASLGRARSFFLAASPAGALVKLISLPFGEGAAGNLLSFLCACVTVGLDVMMFVTLGRLAYGKEVEMRRLDLARFYALAHAFMLLALPILLIFGDTFSKANKVLVCIFWLAVCALAVLSGLSLRRVKEILLKEDREEE